MESLQNLGKCFFYKGSKMNKRAKKIFILAAILIAAVAILVFCFKNIKIDEFHPAAVIFVVDSSASNQANLEEQKKLVKQICTRLDPEDKIKIVRVSQDAYLIFEGSPHSSKNITDSMNEFTQYDEKEWGTAYGVGIKKALNYSATMNNDGYKPSVVVIGDLENEGAAEKQVNWSTLPQDIKKLQNSAPDFAMFFAFAHPQKLDFVKSKLSPVLGETKLIISTEQNIDKSVNTFLNAIER